MVWFLYKHYRLYKIRVLLKYIDRQVAQTAPKWTQVTNYELLYSPPS